ncbi:MAG: LytR/AlgR family response regulator transcription factor, partial [Bacteroidales bacterium]
ALVQLQSKQIDILLIDIQMPDLTGLEMVRTLKYRPQIIFTTAYSEYALESYEIEATDYLLKPIAFPRFLQAINKALSRCSPLSAAAATAESTGSALQGSTAETEREHQEERQREEPRLTNMTPDYLVVKADHKLYKINFADLIYIEGQREYVTFHTLHKKITALYSLKDLEEALPSQEFVRIHKSYIISFRYLETLEGNLVTLSGVKLPIGANYRDNLLGRLESR